MAGSATGAAADDGAAAAVTAARAARAAGSAAATAWRLHASAHAAHALLRSPGGRRAPAARALGAAPHPHRDATAVADAVSAAVAAPRCAKWGGARVAGATDAAIPTTPSDSRRPAAMAGPAGVEAGTRGTAVRGHAESAHVFAGGIPVVSRPRSQSTSPTRRDITSCGRTYAASIPTAAAAGVDACAARVPATRSTAETRGAGGWRDSRVIIRWWASGGRAAGRLTLLTGLTRSLHRRGCVARRRKGCKLCPWSLADSCTFSHQFVRYSLK